MRSDRDQRRRANRLGIMLGLFVLFNYFYAIYKAGDSKSDFHALEVESVQRELDQQREIRKKLDQIKHKELGRS